MSQSRRFVSRALSLGLVLAVAMVSAACAVGGGDVHRAAIVRPAQAVGHGCMANPSSCGYPDVGNTGVQPGTSLQRMSGDVHLTHDGEVFQNKLVTGSIWVEAKNVTISNVKLIDTDDYYAIRILPIGASDQNTTIEHVEIDLNGKMGDPSGGDLKGIAFNGYHASHVFFHNGSDCAHMGENVVIQDSLCTDGPDANGDGWPDQRDFCRGAKQHFDGFQSDGGHDITLHHNTVRNPCDQTSAILISSNTEPISNIRITDNLLAGGGYSLYCAGDDDPSRVTNETVTGNRFARTWFPRGGYYGPAAYCGSGFADEYADNTWDNGGGAVGGQRGGRSGARPSRPRVTRLRVRPRVVHRGHRARIHLLLSRRATVSVRLERRAGRRWVGAGRVAHRRLGRGARTVAFRRVGHHRPRVGRYRVVARATASGTRGPVARAHFRIVH
jgi:hypothetical protein